MNQIVPTRAHLFHTLYRFPATILCCWLFCALAIFNNHVLGLHLVELFLGMVFIASVLFTVSQLAFESSPKRARLLVYSIAFLVVAAMTLYRFTIEQEVPFRWSFILMAIATIALMPIAPFIRSSSSSDRVFTFSFTLARQVLFAAIISGVTLGGLTAIALSIGMLFDVKYPVAFADIGVVIGSLFYSGLVLVGVPPDGKRDELPFGAHLIQMLVGYVVIPLLILYGGILYWYFVVLCFTQSLPAGVIVYMVGGFGSVGIFAYLTLDHSQTYQMGTNKLFKKYFFRFLLVPLFLMAMSIGIRVHEHGLTWLRFIVVMMVTWFFLVTVFSFTRNKNYLSRFVYSSLAVMALITACALKWIYSI